MPYITPGTKFRAIAAGGAHTVALNNDGSVVAWGFNGWGESTVPLEARGGVKAIAAGGWEAANGMAGHTVALKDDGSVIAWGSNGIGKNTVPPEAASGVVAIAAGGLHAVALKNDGSVITWGWGSTATLAAPGSGVTAIAAGYEHTVALKNDGSVIAWGNNIAGQSTVPADARNGVAAIAAGYAHTVTLKYDGSVIAWGDNGAGQTTVPTEARSGIAAIAAGSVHTVALKNDGSVIAWGWNGYGQTSVPLEAQSGVIAIAAGYWHTVALKNDGSIIAWGYKWDGYTSVPSDSRSRVITVAAGGPPPSLRPFGRTLALRNDGSLISWGCNVVAGALAGEITVPPEAQSGVIAVAAGANSLYGHSLALKNNGSVIAWGDNRHSQTNIPLDANSGVTAIVAGGGHSLALKYDGSVIAWGLNDHGQASVPAEARSGVTAIAAGRLHTVALKNDGSVIAWGWNEYGQTTVPVEARSGVTAIAAGGNHTVALKNGGLVIAWGNLGQTTVPAAAQIGVIAIAAGEDHIVALKNDGSVSAWGSNNRNGQSTVPLGLPPAFAIASGGNLTVALIRDGSDSGSPRIITSPQTRNAQAGSTVDFTVQVVGARPLVYQWRKNGIPIPSATESTLTLNSVTAADSGQYSVLVSNSFGSVLSEDASLAVLADGANGSTISQPNYPNLGPGEPGKDSLVFITHGRTPSKEENPHAWVDEMKTAIKDRVTSNWMVLGYKWTDYARDWKTDVWAFAIAERALLRGNEVAVQLAALGKLTKSGRWEHIHLIAHSAGSALIQRVAELLSDQTNPPTIHMTFLDPYGGRIGALRPDYGGNAEFTDNYFAEGEVISNWTAGALPNAFNANVSWVDPDKLVLPTSDLFSCVAHSSHGWPHNFYLKSVKNELDFCAKEYGFSLSKEAGGWDNRSNYKKGDLKLLCPGTCPAPESSNIYSWLQRPEPIEFNAYVNIDLSSYTSPFPEVTLSGSSGFNITSLTPPLRQSVSKETSSAREQAAENAPWLAIAVPVTNLVNIIQFQSEFTSAPGAEGLFTVWWNTNQIGVLDERVVDAGLQTYRFPVPATLTSGLYTLSFRLDTFSDMASSISVTNIATGYFGIKEPIALAASLTESALPLIELTAPAGYNYLLQTSKDLHEWTPSALLVNTNGSVRFLDSSPTSASQRFYRAVLP